MTEQSDSFEQILSAEVRDTYYRGIEIARKFGPDYNEDALRDKYIDWQEEHILEAHTAAVHAAVEAFGEEIEATLDEFSFKWQQGDGTVFIQTKYISEALAKMRSGE